MRSCFELGFGAEKKTKIEFSSVSGAKRGCLEYFIGSLNYFDCLTKAKEKIKTIKRENIKRETIKHETQNTK